MLLKDRGPLALLRGGDRRARFGAGVSLTEMRDLRALVDLGERCYLSPLHQSRGGTQTYKPARRVPGP